MCRSSLLCPPGLFIHLCYLWPSAGVKTSSRTPTCLPSPHPPGKKATSSLSGSYPLMNSEPLMWPLISLAFCWRGSCFAEGVPLFTQVASLWLAADKGTGETVRPFLLSPNLFSVFSFTPPPRSNATFSWPSRENPSTRVLIFFFFLS